jgi:ABC-2 type transport system permease protein
MIAGYMLPLLPITVAQAAVCFLFAIPLGLTVSINIVYAVLGIIPMAVFNIALGLLCGSVLGVKQVGGICGALLTNLSAWLSGIWFDLDLVGGAFKKIAYLLPFVHAVEMERAVILGNLGDSLVHLLWVSGYALCITGGAVLLFLRRMNQQ